jgi:PadR family transcriptional regulator, regulatory protein PadR
MAEMMIHEFLLGFIKIYILQYASREPVCGKEIFDQLEKIDYRISYGTLYNTFHSFERKGYLVHKDRNVNGKIRKYYTLTRRGEEALQKAKEKSRVLFDAIQKE